MKLCPKCAASPLPFVMIIVIAGVIGFITWLTLGLSEWDPWPRFGVAAVSTLAVAATLWHYVLTCMRRHCRHHDSIRRMTTASHQISPTS